MNRRILFAAPLAAALLLAGHSPAEAQAAGFVPTPTDQQDLARIQAYLNGVRSLKARFTQVAADDSVTHGTAWLVRPGRMRFQYDPPSPLLLVAGSGLVVFYDKELNQTSNIPIGQTPLGILLRDNFTLSGDVTVNAITRQPGFISISLYRTASPGDGSLSLTFSDNPLVLRNWVVLDAQRRSTRVSLSDIQLGGSYESSLFHFVDPRFNDSHSGSGGG